LLSDENLLLALRELSKGGQRAPTLLLLAHVSQPAQVSAIRDKGIAIGFRTVSQWNLSAILRGAANDGLVAQLKSGWKILAPGLKILGSYYTESAPLISETRHALREYIDLISDPDRRRFIEEALLSFDARAYRAAIVLSWVGAAYIIKKHIAKNHLSAFNAAGVARFKNKFSSLDELAEAKMLQVCQDAGIFDKAQKQELGERLDLRNRCGHPNAVNVAEHVVAAHIESLLLNVYSRY
jgi:hypothetical protein